MLPVDELQRALTPDEVEATILRLQEALGLKTTSWRPGGMAKTLNKVFARLGSGFSKLVVTLNTSNFTDTAVGNWLSLRVPDLFGPDVGRIEETFARGTLTVDNAGGGIYSFEPYTFVVKDSTTGATFHNVDTLDVDALETGVEITIEATEAGAASTAAPGNIDTLETVAIGLSVTNAEALVGTDAETDADYRVRARESAGRLSPNGPRDAYAWRAKTTKRADGTGIAINRVSVSASGVPVLVRVASPSGAVDSGDVTLIQTAVDTDVVPDGVSATVSSATALPVSVTATLYVRAELATADADIVSAVEKKLADHLSSAATAPIGGFVVPPAATGKVFRNAIIGVLEALELDGVQDAAQYVIKADVAAPAEDVDVAATQVPTAGTPSITVVKV